MIKQMIYGNSATNNNPNVSKSNSPLNLNLYVYVWIKNPKTITPIENFRITLYRLS